ncbi:hypothetical protein AWV79_34070 [Cupriavidus sp. UYMMa02A]|nr:hypothetical protein AWV79_34070 [Cupriavidus sp. UYMMa02A]
MRRGRDGRNLESYLRSNGSVTVYTLTDKDVTAISELHGIQLPDAEYLAHKLEKRILLDGFTKWAWNKRS